MLCVFYSESMIDQSLGKGGEDVEHLRIRSVTNGMYVDLPVVAPRLFNQGAQRIQVIGQHAASVGCVCIGCM